MNQAHDASRFVSRAGLKLEHGLRAFNIDVTGLVCADFGCNVGGFTDCLLQRGAQRVYAIDTGYNVLAYKLRVDRRVIVMERTNALHAEKPEGENIDLVVIDLAWTKQRHALPAALRWLQPAHGAIDAGRSVLSKSHEDGRGSIITLVKPHYELEEEEKAQLLKDGQLAEADAEAVLKRVLEQMPSWGAEPMSWTKSPITGGKSSRKRKGGGNVEYLVLARPLFAAVRPTV